MSEWVRALSASFGSFLKYSWALGGTIPEWLAWLAFIFVLTSRPVRNWWASRSSTVRTWLPVVFLPASLILVWKQASLLDDAHISLRYADNLVQGHGLVFNVGERVEGYTNFLWTVLLAGGMWLGLDGEQLAVAGCVVCFVLEVLLVLRVSRMLHGDAAAPALPWAAIFLGANLIFTEFGTSGMETMFATLLVTAAFERALSGCWFWSGVLGIAATMAHPDHGLLYAGLGLSLLLDKNQRRQIFAYAAPFAFIYVPYFLVRWKYYGDFFPNTYYAKSGGSSYFSQGTIYFVASFLATELLALSPLVLAGWFETRSQLLRRFFLFGCGMYLLYVVKMGGDFMLGRLFVPVLPFFALLGAEGFEALLASTERRKALIATGLFALACTPVRVFEPVKVEWGISDEPTWYRLTSFFPVVVASPFSHRMRAFQRLSDAGVRPLVSEISIGLTGYKSKLPMVDIRGLTDREVAHQPLKERGRPGHEKTAQPIYLHRRGVQLSVISFYSPRFARRTAVTYEGFPYYVGTYDAEFFSKLVPLGFVPPNTPQQIDELIWRADWEVAETLTDELKFFESFYFSKNPDPERHQRLRAAIDRRLKALSLNGGGQGVQAAKGE